MIHKIINKFYTDRNKLMNQAINNAKTKMEIKGVLKMGDKGADLLYDKDDENTESPKRNHKKL